MEADWEFEIAADAPVIDAAWSGYVDLRSEPDCASQLAEAAVLPALAETLVALNASSPSPLWTAKCDVWEAGPVDADEFDAAPEAALSAIVCYIDVLPGVPEMWPTLDAIADWCRTVCSSLRASPLRQCRLDLVVRGALLTSDQPALGVTAYLAGCGSSRSAAIAALSACLRVFEEGVGDVAMRASPGAKLQ